MYRCDDCGLDFAVPKRVTDRHGFDDGPGETYECCPYCGGQFLPIKACHLCGVEVTEDEMFGGVCKECLEESITYDGFLKFSDSTEDNGWQFSPNRLQEFFFEELFAIPNMTESSSALRRELRELYLRKVAHEKLCGKHDLLKAIKRHVMDDSETCQAYAEWLTWRDRS